MVPFFQKYRIFLIVVSCGLTLLGLALWKGRHEEPLLLFTIPGVLLGVCTYLINSKGKKSSNVSGDADELIKWNQLKESGAISDEEYEKKKKEVLG
jgi:hypothetical protein